MQRTSGTRTPSSPCPCMKWVAPTSGSASPGFRVPFVGKSAQLAPGQGLLPPPSRICRAAGAGKGQQLAAATCAASVPSTPQLKDRDFMVDDISFRADAAFVNLPDLPATPCPRPKAPSSPLHQATHKFKIHGSAENPFEATLESSPALRLATVAHCDWRALALRMPAGMMHTAVEKVPEDVKEFLSGKARDISQSEDGQMLLRLHLQGKPSGRRHAQLVSWWMQNELNAASIEAGLGPLPVCEEPDPASAFTIFSEAFDPSGTCNAACAADAAARPSRSGTALGSAPCRPLGAAGSPEAARKCSSSPALGKGGRPANAPGCRVLKPQASLPEGSLMPGVRHAAGQLYTDAAVGDTAAAGCERLAKEAEEEGEGAQSVCEFVLRRLEGAMSTWIEDIASKGPAWCRMMKVVGMTAASAVHATAKGCLERGVLMAHCWNMYTELMDAQYSMQTKLIHRLQEENQALRSQVDHLGTILDHDKENRETIATLEREKRALEGTLLIAAEERDKQIEENIRLHKQFKGEMAEVRKGKEQEMSQLQGQWQNAEAALTTLNTQHEALQERMDSSLAKMRALAALVLKLREMLAGLPLGSTEDGGAWLQLPEVSEDIGAAEMASEGSEAPEEAEPEAAEGEGTDEQKPLRFSLSLPPTSKEGGADPEPAAALQLTATESTIEAAAKDEDESTLRSADSAVLQSMAQYWPMSKAKSAPGSNSSVLLPSAAQQLVGQAQQQQPTLGTLKQADASTPTAASGMATGRPGASLLLAPAPVVLNIKVEEVVIVDKTGRRTRKGQGAAAGQARGMRATGSFENPDLLKTIDRKGVGGAARRASRAEQEVAPDTAQQASQLLKQQAQGDASAAADQAKGKGKGKSLRGLAALTMKAGAGGGSGPQQQGAVPSLKSLQTMQETVSKVFSQGGVTGKLRDAVAGMASKRPRTLEWLLRFIEGLYKGKVNADEQRLKMGLSPQTLADFMFQHLSGTYGTKHLVNDYATSAMATMMRHVESDKRVTIFSKFMSEEWSTSALSVYLDAMRRASEPARFVCVDYPTDYVPKRYAPFWIDTRKCLFLADAVLSRRSVETTAAFASNLLLHSEPATEEEMKRFWVAPGVDPSDHSKVKAEDIQNFAGYYKIPYPLFMLKLLEEYNRCEACLEEALPGLFRAFDHDYDSLLSFDDVVVMMQKVAHVEFDKDEATGFWDKLVSAELTNNTARAGDSTIAPGQKVGPVSFPVNLVGLQAFQEVAKSNQHIRNYIRLHNTPPAPRALTEQENQKIDAMLRLIITRHWNTNSARFRDFFANCGTSEIILHEQSTKLVSEASGVRAAAVYCSILQLMCESVLRSINQQCRPEVLAAQFDVSLEPKLYRIENAVKVLHGMECVIEEDLLMDEEGSGMSTLQMSRLTNMKRQAAVFNRMRGKIQGYAVKILSYSFAERVRAWLQRIRDRMQSEGTTEDRTAKAATEAGDRVAGAAQNDDGAESVESPKPPAAEDHAVE